ncbi:MAG: aldo/keto reductase [Candidatus Synoicihabitans palmerolidicus]|nr:aldo/keto reductase [Candidatus Synoicihabitans palmerolidicus]
MQTRSLGSSGIETSPLGLGCWAIGGPFWVGDTPLSWGEVVDQESIAALRRGLDLGITFIDTANVYGAGRSERVVGAAVAGRRDEVVIATKFSSTFDETSRQTADPSDDPSYIRRACEASLRRLNTDRIDLYQYHWNDGPLESAAAVQDTLEALVSEGEIRAYGWSTDFPDRARAWLGGAHYASVQHQLNVITDAPAIIQVCEEAGLTSINRGPLAMGLLTGKYTTGTTVTGADVRSAHSPEWMQYFKNGHPAEVWLDKLTQIREILTSGGRTLSQGALAWLWARSPCTLPIPEFRTVPQVEENAGALAFGPLTPDQMREIAGLLNPTT